MDEAFWDSSALVPLCVEQKATRAVRQLSATYGIAVWWSAPVEIRGAFARLLRMRQMTLDGQVQAQVTLDRIGRVWREVYPSEPVRSQAERLVDRFPLKAADALQLAAALTWCSGRPNARALISGDAQLLDAAQRLGFQAIQA